MSFSCIAVSVSLMSPDATPELRDAKATMTVNNVHPDFSNGLIMTEGGQLNLQRDDIAIMW